MMKYWSKCDNLLLKIWSNQMIRRCNEKAMSTIFLSGDSKTSSSSHCWPLLQGLSYDHDEDQDQNRNWGLRVRTTKGEDYNDDWWSWNSEQDCIRLEHQFATMHLNHNRVDFEREIEWLRAKRDEVWQRVALLERVAGDDDDDDDRGHPAWGNFPVDVIIMTMMVMIMIVSPCLMMINIVLWTSSWRWWLWGWTLW